MTRDFYVRVKADFGAHVRALPGGKPPQQPLHLRPEARAGRIAPASRQVGGLCSMLLWLVHPLPSFF